MAFPERQGEINTNMPADEYERVKAALEARDRTKIKYGACDGGVDCGGMYFEFEGAEYYLYEIFEMVCQLKRVRTLKSPEEYEKEFIKELEEAMEEIKNDSQRN